MCWGVGPEHMHFLPHLSLFPPQSNTLPHTYFSTSSYASPPHLSLHLPLLSPHPNTLSTPSSTLPPTHLPPHLSLHIPLLPPHPNTLPYPYRHTTHISPHLLGVWRSFWQPFSSAGLTLKNLRTRLTGEHSEALNIYYNKVFPRDYLFKCFTSIAGLLLDLSQNRFI